MLCTHCTLRWYIAQSRLYFTLTLADELPLEELRPQPLGQESSAQRVRCVHTAVAHRTATCTLSSQRQDAAMNYPSRSFFLTFEELRPQPFRQEVGRPLAVPVDRLERGARHGQAEQGLFLRDKTRPEILLYYWGGL